LNSSIILPTYQERGNIVPLIEAIEANLIGLGDYEIIVVDDASPDGTADLVQERFGNDACVRLHVRRTERGLATAILCGLQQATGDVLVVMDTDFNHDPDMLPQMVEFLKYYDLIVGSRFVMGGGMEDGTRHLLSFLYNLFVRAVLRTPVQDNLSGFFAIRREKLRMLDLQRICYGYGDYFLRLLHVAWQCGFKILEVPVFYQLRRHGGSKSRFLGMLAGYTISVFKLRFGRS
jgi:dolichol-phosphate mannosyltransferase